MNRRKPGSPPGGATGRWDRRRLEITSLVMRAHTGQLPVVGTQRNHMRRRQAFAQIEHVDRGSSGMQATGQHRLTVETDDKNHNAAQAGIHRCQAAAAKLQGALSAGDRQPAERPARSGVGGRACMKAVVTLTNHWGRGPEKCRTPCPGDRFPGPGAGLPSRNRDIALDLEIFSASSREEIRRAWIVFLQQVGKTNEKIPSRRMSESGPSNH